MISVDFKLLTFKRFLVRRKLEFSVEDTAYIVLDIFRGRSVLVCVALAHSSGSVSIVFFG